jgi:hypothetical protein
VIAALAQTLPSEQMPATPASPIALARQAHLNRDYDTALLHALQIGNDLERTQLLAAIAFESANPIAAVRAVEAYWDLPEEQKGDSRLKHLIDYLTTTVFPGTTEPQPGTSIVDWIDWLELALSSPTSPMLGEASARLSQLSDPLPLPRVGVLGDQLLRLLDATALSRSLREQSLQGIATTLLADSEFPRSEIAFSDAYEALLENLLQNAEHNADFTALVLRLAEALLRQRPSQAAQIANSLIDRWFDTPLLALEAWAVDVLELLGQYGISPQSVISWYRRWAAAVLAGRQPSALALHTWLSLGEWIQPGEDLLRQFRDALSSAPSREDPLLRLPADYHIAIFMLRDSTAARVRDQLVARNPHLHVTICTELDMSPQVRAAAENADMPVVVTRCITHAITYGIMPILRADPVYPLSSGSSSILAAIEQHIPS